MDGRAKSAVAVQTGIDQTKEIAPDPGRMREDDFPQKTSAEEQEERKKHRAETAAWLDLWMQRAKDKDRGQVWIRMEAHRYSGCGEIKEDLGRTPECAKHVLEGLEVDEGAEVKEGLMEYDVAAAREVLTNAMRDAIRNGPPFALFPVT